jgi:hypothetical protein
MMTLLPGFDPVPVLLGAPDPLAVREVGRDLVDVHAGIHADDVAPALEGNVPTSPYELGGTGLSKRARGTVRPA